MPKLFQIARKHYDTFYDNRTLERRSLLLRFTILTFVTTAFLILFGEQSSDFFSAIRNAQAIIAGFSFSSLTFLASTPDPLPLLEHNSDSLEYKAKRKRVSKLVEELFYNITYFLIITVAAISLSTFTLSSDLIGRLSGIKGLQKLHSRSDVLVGFHLPMHSVVTICFQFSILILTIESTATFIRNTQRLMYLFDEKIKGAIARDSD